MARQGPRRGRGEGSVTPRKDGRYAAYITLENGKRKYFYAKTKKAALDLLRKAQLEQMQGTLVTSSPRLTVAEFFTQWIEKRKPAVKIRTHERYESFIRLQVIPPPGQHPAPETHADAPAVALLKAARRWEKSQHCEHPPLDDPQGDLGRSKVGVDCQEPMQGGRTAEAGALRIQSADRGGSAEAAC